MKKIILIMLMLVTMTAHADRYYGPSGKMPYVKSSNKAYQKSWNSHAKRVNVQLNVIRTRAVSDRLNARSYSNDYTHDYSDSYTGGHGTASYADYGDQSPSEFQKCVNAIKSDDSKGENTNTFAMRKQRMACSTIEKY